MGVKGHLGSPEVKRSKPFKHNISRTITARDFILSMFNGHIEFMIFIVFCGGQLTLFGVTKGHNLVNIFLG